MMLERLGERFRKVGIPPSVLTDSAAALTYYTVLSLFPGLALVIAALALVGGNGIVDSVLEIVRTVAPPEVADTLSEPISRMSSDEGMSVGAVVLGGSIALFSASRYVAAFGRAADRVQGLDPAERAFWRGRPLAIALVAAMIVLLPLGLLALLITGPIADAVASELGVSDTLRELFAVLRWPLLGVAGAGILSVLYLSSEGMRRAGARQVIPGALAAIAIWLVASGLFSVFVSNLTSFSLTYGSLAGVVVLLIWLYVTNLAALSGMTINVVRARRREPDGDPSAGDEGAPGYSPAGEGEPAA